MARSLHFELGWPFVHRTVRTIYRRLAKPKTPDLYILSLDCHFCIAPYEQFINFCPSPERSQMARSFTF